MKPTEADPLAADQALGAGGLLREFNRAGVLAAADVHVAARLCELSGEHDEAVALAVALAVRGPRHGHVFVDLAQVERTVAVDPEAPAELPELAWPEPATWQERVARSPLTATGEPSEGASGGDAAPVRLLGTWLYLDRYWSEERQVAAALRRLSGGAALATPEELRSVVDRLFGEEDSTRQRQAVALAALRRLSVVAGGPGTGKTTTVARIVALLCEQSLAQGERLPLIALAAPTGKAAARLQEAVHEEAARLDVSEATRGALVGLQATTIHRLLGSRPDSRSRFRHDARRRLPHDAVIIDETSMVPLSLMTRLLEAIRPQARLVLVGDPDQLASVEAGAVFGDIVGPAREQMTMSEAARERLSAASGAPVVADERPAGPPTGNGIVVLTRGHRFGRGIAAVADAVRHGDGDRLIALLLEHPDDVEWIVLDAEQTAEAEQLAPIRERALRAAQAVQAAASEGEGAAALSALASFRLLCAHRRGPAGAATWNDRIEEWLTASSPGAARSPWYVGRPLLITRNDYELGLFNGDSGVIVAPSGTDPMAAFERGATPVLVSPARLAAVQTLYAMTIHRSQGSQFDAVAVLLPAPDARILTRELLYTALTRARRKLVLAASEATLRAAVDRPVARASGLRRRLWEGDAR